MSDDKKSLIEIPEETPAQIEAKLARIQEEAERIDQEVVRGCSFSLKRDPADPRFDFITVRVPNMHISDRDATIPEEVELHGALARWRFVRLVLATCADVGEMFAAPREFRTMIKVLYNEVRVQEVTAEEEPKTDA